MVLSTEGIMSHSKSSFFFRLIKVFTVLMPLLNAQFANQPQLGYVPAQAPGAPVTGPQQNPLNVIWDTDDHKAYRTDVPTYYLRDRIQNVRVSRGQDGKLYPVDEAQVEKEYGWTLKTPDGYITDTFTGLLWNGVAEKYLHPKTHLEVKIANKEGTAITDINGNPVDPIAGVVVPVNQEGGQQSAVQYPPPLSPSQPDVSGYSQDASYSYSPAAPLSPQQNEMVEEMAQAIKKDIVNTVEGIVDADSNLADAETSSEEGKKSSGSSLKMTTFQILIVTSGIMTLNN